MKRLKKTRSYDFPSTILFLDDVIKIYKILSEGGYKDIYIETGIESNYYKLESPDEFKRLEKEVDRDYITELDIRSGDVSVFFYSKASLYTIIWRYR